MADVKNPFLNLCIIQGRLGADPEMKFLPSGMPLATFSIANTKYQNKNGERIERTRWIECKAFAKTAEIVQERLRKGMNVQVQGEWDVEEWTDQATGGKRKKAVLLANRADAMEWQHQQGAAPGGYQGGQPPAAPYNPPQQPGGYSQQGGYPSAGQDSGYSNAGPPQNAAPGGYQGGRYQGGQPPAAPYNPPQPPQQYNPAGAPSGDWGADPEDDIPF